jgi:orotate phosphoribosyltransferase
MDARGQLFTLSAPGAFYTASVILEMTKNLNLSAIGGPTLGADPMVGAVGSLSFQQGKPVDTFIIRKQPKAHGKQQQIEGPAIADNARIVIIDDVATTGKAFVESIEVLAKMGIKPLKAICIIDRNEGAREALAKYDVPLESIFTINDFLK